MPRRPLPTVRGGLLYPLDDSDPIALDGPQWRFWIDSDAGGAFGYLANGGRITVRRERRAERYYWYAFQRHGGRLLKRYIGRSDELSAARLAVVAREIASEAGTTSALAAQAPALQMPVPAQDAFRRLALFAQLDQTPPGGMTFVSAPAGYGKTTLLSTWALQLGQPVVWFTVQTEEHDPSRFWGGLLVALDTAIPGAGRQLRVALQGAQELTPEVIAADLVASLQRAPVLFTLVLDDYHRVRSESIHAALGLLLERLPAHVRLLFASREVPPAPLARLRAQGKLRELGVELLRFRADEARLLLESASGSAIGDDVLDELYRRSEGWAAALRLAGLAARTTELSALLLDPLRGTGRSLFDYLADEVLPAQPPELIEPLLVTALPAQINGQLCAALLELPVGGQAGAALLQRIERAGLFLSRLDGAGEWYRYHQLFSETLRARLAQHGDQRLRTLHLRAAHWYAEAGMAAEAIDHAFAAKDSSLAAELIAGVLEPTLFGQGQTATVERWLQTVPQPELFAHPRLAAYNAYLLAVARRIPLAELSISHAWQALETAPASLLARGEVALMASVVAELAGDQERSIAFAREATSLLPDDALGLRSQAELQFSDVVADRDTPAAEAAVYRALALSSAAGHLFTQLMCYETLTDIQYRAGSLRTALATIQQAQPWVEQNGLEQAANNGYLVGLHGLILGRQGQVDAACVRFEQALAIGKAAANQGVQIFARFSLARLRFWQGDNTAAMAQLDVANGVLATQRGDHAATIATLPVWFALSRGDLEQATVLGITLERALPPEDVLRTTTGMLPVAALARLKLAQGQPDQALRLLRPARQRIAAAGRNSVLIDLLALEALILAALGEGVLARQTLTSALELAAPEAVVQPFVELGEPMRLLLRSVPFGEPARYAAELVLDTWPLHTDSARLPLPSLTPRERQTLELLAAGQRVAQIAAVLVVSESTVRSYLKRLYAKLGVRGQAEASALARFHLGRDPSRPV